jgi:hypothetical protein
MSDKTELIYYLILLVFLLFYAGKLAWKYSPHFISQRERRGLSDWLYGKKRVGMVASTCFVVFFFYDMFFLDPLVKKMKLQNDKKTVISDTERSSPVKSVSNQNNKKLHKKHYDTLTQSIANNMDSTSHSDTGDIKTDTVKSN